MALVSSYDRLKELSETAAESEDASQLQFLKTLDSVDAKVQQLQTNMQSLYVSSGIEKWYKKLLDFGNNVIKTFTQLSKAFNSPTAAVAKFGSAFLTLATFVTHAFSLIKNRLGQHVKELNIIQKMANNETLSDAEKGYFKHEMLTRNHYQRLRNITLQGEREIANVQRQSRAQRTQDMLNAEKILTQQRVASGIGMGASAIGFATSLMAANMDVNTQRQEKALWTGISGALSGVGTGALLYSSMGPWGAAIGALTALPSILEAFNMWAESAEERVDRLKESLESATNDRIKSKDELKTLSDYKKKYEEVYKARNDNNEAYQDYLNLSNEIANKYPELIAGMDKEGNYLVELTDKYDSLLKVKQQVYSQDLIKEGTESIKAYSDTNFLLQALGLKDLAPEPSFFAYGDSNFLGTMNTYLKGLTQEQFKDMSYQDLFFNMINQDYDRKVMGRNMNYSNEAISSFFSGITTGGFHEDKIDDVAKKLGVSKDVYSKLLHEGGWSWGINDANGMRTLLTIVGKAFDEGKDQSTINSIIKEVFGNEAGLNGEMFSYINLLKTTAPYRESYVTNLIESLNKINTSNSISAQGLQVDQLQTDFINDQVQQKWKNSNEYKLYQNNQMDLDKAWQAFMFNLDTTVKSAYDAFKYYNGFNEDQQKQVNDFYKNMKHYTSKDIMTILPFLNEEIDAALIAYLTNKIDETSQAIRDRFTTGMQEAGITETIDVDGKSTELTKFILDNFGADYLDSILSNFKKAYSSETNSDKLKKAWVGLYQNLAALDALSQEKALNIIDNGDLTSLVGIYSVIEDLQDAGIVNDEVSQSLLQLSHAITINLPIELSSFSQNVVKQVDDFNKALSNASKGMELDDAIEMADKLKVSISDFKFINGKYFYKDAKKIQEVYYKYNQELLGRLDDEYDAQRVELENQLKDDNIDPKKYNDLQAQLFNLQKSHDSITAAIKQYGEYQVNAALINNGYIEEFIHNIQDRLEENVSFQDIMQHFSNKDFSDLSEEDKQYIPLILDYLNNSITSVYDAALAGIRGEGVQTVSVTENNKQLLTELGAEFIEGTDKALLKITKDNLAEVYEYVIDSLNSGEITEAKAQSLLADLYNEQYKDNITNSLGSIIDNYQSFGYEAAQSLANAFKFSIDKMEEQGLISRDEITGQFSTTIQNLRFLMALALERGMDIKSANQYISKIDQAEREASVAHVMQDVIKNRTSLTEENIRSLADSLNRSYADVKSLLKQNTDGTYTMGLATLKTLIDEGVLEINDTLQQLIAEQINNIISSITGLASNQNHGYTNIADMQKYVQQIREAGFSQINEQGEEKDIDIKSLFKWDSSINAFVLTSAGIISQVAAAKSQLDNFVEGSDEYFVITQLMEDTARQFAGNIDFTSILGSGTAQELDKAKKAFESAIEDYNTYVTAIGHASEALNATNIEDILKRGGTAAIDTAQELAGLAGKELSTSDVETIYRAQIAPLISAIDQVEGSIGSIISSNVKDIIGESHVIALGTTGQFVIKSAIDLVNAYEQLYQKIYESGEATLAELNDVMARKYEAQSDADVISALSNAAEMTYHEFGEILTKAGKEWGQTTIDQLESLNIIKKIGGGKLRIIDFDSFAQSMGWERNSEAYISAFKSYNDAIVSLNQKTKHDIAEEIKNVSSAKVGDQVNVTQLYYKLIDEGVLGSLNAMLSTVGATITDGILTIQNNANLPAIMQAIQQVAQEKNLILAEDLAALADTINDVLKSFADTLSAGIAGTLNNVQAHELKTTAKNMFGIDIDLHETVNGFKVSIDQAIQLYNQLQSINNVAASIVFDGLRDSLEATGEACENITKTMASIKLLEADIGKGPDNTKLQERLSLYNQIAATQMQNPDQYDFMGRNLPDYLKGPENYWNSIGKAFTSMNEAASTGYVGISDFYNIVNEMNNLATLGGNIEFLGYTLDGKLESAAALIQKGFSSLSNVDGKGVKINLNKFSVDFAKGAESMTDNVESGIEKMAQSQIDMLDGMIALLETVVAMEKIGDIIGENNVLDIKDMFHITGNIAKSTDDMSKLADGIITAAKKNEDLANALDSIIFNGTSLRVMLEKAQGQVELSKTDAEVYFSAINSLYQMLLSGDYDLDNLINSISDVAKKSGFEGEVQIGNIKLAIGYGFVLESDGDGVYDVDGTEYTDATTALQAYALKKESDIEDIQVTTDESGKVITTGTYKVGDIKFDVVASDGKVTYTDPDGNEYYSQGKAAKAVYRQYIADNKEKSSEENGEPLDPIAYAASVGIDAKLLVGEVRIDNPEKFQAATHEQIVALANALAGDGNVIEAASNIGIKVDVAGKITEADRKKIAELAGIDSKTVVMDISATFNGEEGKQLAEILNDKSITVAVNLVPGTDETGLIFDGESGASASSDNINTGASAKINITSITAQYTGDAIQILDANNQVISVIPGEALGEFDVTSISAQYNKGAIQIVDAQGQVITEIPQDVVGQLKVVSITAQRTSTGAIQIKDSAGEVIQEIPQDVAGKLNVTSVTAKYDTQNNQIQLIDAQGEVITTIPAEKINATTTIGNLTGTYTGTPQLKDAAGEDYTVAKVGNLNGTGNIIQLTLSWVDNIPNINSADIIDGNTVYLGTYSGTADLEEVNFNDAHKVLRDSIYMQTQKNPSNDKMATWAQEQSDQVTNQFGGIKYQIQSESELQRYLNSVQKLLNEGRALSQIDLTNLDALATIGKSASGMFMEDANGRKLSDVIADLKTQAELNAQTQQEQLNALAAAFATLDPTNLQACAEAMATLATNANSVMSINWMQLADGINAINTPDDTSLLSQTDALQREVNAKIKLDYNGDATAQEVIETPVLEREIVFTSNLDTLLASLNKLSTTISTTTATPTTTTPNINSEGLDAVTTAAPSVKHSDTSETESAIGRLSEVLKGLTEQCSTAVRYVGDVADAMAEIPERAYSRVDNLSNSMNNIPAVGGRIAAASTALSTLAARCSSLATAIGQVPTIKNIDLVVRIKTIGNGTATISPSGPSGLNNKYTAANAKGNIALAAGTKKTLVGELGPELIVSNGRYFVAGENGAEMIDLAPDAIVFNHLQTKRLLSNGSSGRGIPITNEKNAVAFASGNTEGPALASAGAALSALKQIRAMWQSMLGASLSDLGAQAGGGGGGGGGSKDANKLNAGFIADLERWYNLLRQIAKLEKDINYEQKLRQKLQSDLISNGKAYYESQKRTLKALDQQIAKNQDLSALQKSYYDQRRKDLAESNYGKIFTFNEEGLMQYNDDALLANGDRGGLFALAKINAQNPDGSTVYTAQQQYEILRSWGFEEAMKYDNSGKEIIMNKDSKNADDFYTSSVQAFWDKIDGWKDELDNLYDSYNDALNSVLDEEVQRNEILREMQENQLNLEQKVLKAIENREQKIIDALEKEKDALEDATNAYIDGLNKHLQKERDMYQQNQDSEDLNKMRRQLAILQRSGGSASQIRSLQEQIKQKEQDAYFDAQQKQIDAIEEASEKEIERLETQIDILKETLEYQKEHGLLWNEVSEIMARTPEEIMDFLQNWSPDLEGLSALGQESTMQEIRSIVEQWSNRRDDKEEPVEVDRRDEAGEGWTRYAAQIQPEFSQVWSPENVARAEQSYRTMYALDSDPNKAAAAARKVFEEAMEEYYRLHPKEDPHQQTIDLPGGGQSAPAPAPSSGGGGSSGGTSTPVKEPEPEPKPQSQPGQLGLIYKSGSKVLDKRVLTVSPGTYKAVKFQQSFAGYTFESSSPSQVTIKSGSYDIISYKYTPVPSVSVQNSTSGSTTTLAPKNNIRNAILQFSSGGLADYTGLAMVHGSKTRPEAFLNAEETKIWREDILSGNKGSLTSNLLALNAMANDVIVNGLGNTTNNSGGNITIEHAEVNMNATISNDYDARRAGQNALEEMVRIARKTSVQNIRR